MTDKPHLDIAEEIYAEGMKYNWREAESPANAMLARACLERAAATGHTKALRELSEMMFQGSGGLRNQEHALWLKWSACARGDFDAFEELSTLLESFALSLTHEDDRRRAIDGARKAEEVAEQLQWLKSYLHELVRLNLTQTGQQ